MSDMENIHIELDDESDFQASLISDMQTSLTEGDRDQAPAPAPPTPDTAPEETQPDWIGKVLGHFKLLRLIGQGSMGFVVQARDMHLKRIVALKILRRRIKGLPDEKRVLQFLREAQAAARIEHPNVIHVYEIDQHEGWWYLAMEWLEGRTCGPWSTPPGRFRPRGRAPCWPMPPSRCPSRTSRASSTGTSSPPTSCSPAPGGAN